MEQTTGTMSGFEYDSRWATLQPGELAEMIGAGDPNEIVAGPTPATYEELETQ